MALPEPMWSDADIAAAREVARNPASLILNTWIEDPTKLAVLRAMISCQVRLSGLEYFGWDMARALAQKSVCFLHSIHWK